MKYTKHIGAVLIGSLALIGGTSAYQLYPREGVVDPTANIVTEVEEEVVVDKEEPVGVGVTLTVEPQEVTNPAPLPASEPVVEQSVAEEPIEVGCNTPREVIMVNMDDTRWQKLTVEHTLPWGERINILTLYKNGDGRTFCLNKY